MLPKWIANRPYTYITHKFAKKNINEHQQFLKLQILHKLCKWRNDDNVTVVKRTAGTQE